MCREEPDQAVLPGQAVQINRRMLDVQNDRRAGFDQEDIVGVAAAQRSRGNRTVQAISLLNNAQQLDGRTRRITTSGHRQSGRLMAASPGS